MQRLVPQFVGDILQTPPQFSAIKIAGERAYDILIGPGVIGRAGGEISARLKGIVDEDAQFYHVIRDILVAHLHGNSAQVSVEIGRGNVPTEVQPTFFELEEALNSTSDA